MHAITRRDRALEAIARWERRLERNMRPDPQAKIAYQLRRLDPLSETFVKDVDALLPGQRMTLRCSLCGPFGTLSRDQEAVVEFVFDGSSGRGEVVQICPDCLKAALKLVE